MLNNLLLLILFIFIGNEIYAQSVVKGTVKSLQGQIQPNVEISTEDGQSFTFTDEKGTYRLILEKGIYTITFKGEQGNVFKKLTIKDDNKKYRLDVVLLEDTNTEKIGEVQVIGRRIKKGSEAEALLLQRKALTLKETISSQELSQKGISDVATAVTKVSGISKQEGSNVVYIRGLGDRYNSTTMNGLPIPSNNPEYKNIDLSIFSTDIVQYVDINKVYSSNLFGDFAGGNVNIVSKKQTQKGNLNIGFTAGVNSNAIKDWMNNNNFRLQQGINWLGFDRSKNPNTLSEYAFENRMNPKKSGGFAGGFYLSGGKKVKVGLNGKLSFFALADFKNEYTSIDNGILRSSISLQGQIEGKDFEKYKVFNYNTNTTGLFNLDYQINRKNTINYNSMFVNSSNQKLEEGEGYIRDLADKGALQRRGTFIENVLWVNQLLGQHKLSDRSELNWGTGYNSIKGYMPDRFQNTLQWIEQKNEYIIPSESSANSRYFQQLEENEMVGNVSLDYKFAQDTKKAYKGKLTLGYNGRYKKRAFEFMQYNFYPTAGLVPASFDDLDAFFNCDNFNKKEFRMLTFSGENTKPQFYNGKQSIHGAFLNVEYHLSPRFISIIGLRGESVNQWIEWNTSLDPLGDENKIDEFKFLPSLNLKYELSRQQNLRFAISKTYTIPQFKERAWFIYEDFGESIYGNPYVYPSTDYNVDLKWELFPRSAEILSVTTFGKYIEDPINKFTVASSTNDLSYANTGDWGRVFGGEIEIKKSIYSTHSDNPLKLSVGATTYYANTQQKLNSKKISEETEGKLNADFTHEKDAFQGASDLLLNASISFNKEWKKGSRFMTTLVYNYSSDKIYAIGAYGKGNIVEKGFGTLDLIIRSKITKNIAINFNAKNLLNPYLKRVQENSEQEVVVLSYKKGMNFSLSINYKL